MRRTSGELACSLDTAFMKALDALGVPGELQRDDRVVATAHVMGTDLEVEVRSVVTAGDTAGLVAEAGRRDRPLLVLAERIAGPARDALRQAGVSFYDGRGHLRLTVPGAVLDVPVPPVRSAPKVGDPLAGGVAKEVALAVLEDRDRGWGVREIARRIGRSHATVTVALQRMRAAGLVTDRNEPLVPDLFWDLEAAWHHEAVPLAALPDPTPTRVDELQLGIDRDIGWALTDTLGALAWGMPLIAPGDYPPDFLVPSSVALHRAVSALGRAEDPSRRGCTVSVAPVEFVCRERVRFDRAVWPVASHVVVALDLARDRARGREVIEGWQPPEGINRAW